jgi:hypothetical protein
MTETPKNAGGAGGDQDAAASGKFGGALGSQHKQPPEERPELQQGASGSRPRQQPPPATISGQLGGVGGQASPGSASSGSGSAPQPSQPQRKSGCFGMVLAAACVGAALASGLTVL